MDGPLVHRLDCQVYGRQSKTKLGSERLYEITDHLIQDAIKKGFVKE